MVASRWQDDDAWRTWWAAIAASSGHDFERGLAAYELIYGKPTLRMRMSRLFWRAAYWIQHRAVELKALFPIRRKWVAK